MRPYWLIAGIAGLSLAPSATIRAQQGAPLRLPAPVAEELKSRWPGAQVMSFKRDKGVWEVDLQNDELILEAKLNDAGELLETEEAVDAAALPEAVRQAVEKKFPGAAITQVTRETIGEGEKAKVAYKVETAKGKSKLDPTGKILK